MLCKQYNDTSELQTEIRNVILRKLIPELGTNVYLQGPIFFDFGSNTSIGENSYANFNLTVLDEGKVSIGKSVFIGPNVSFLTPIHPMCYQDRNSFFNRKTGVMTNLERAGKIIVEDDCWIGGNVTVCGNVTIGSGSVIGAGSVVTRNIPPNSFAAGVPCKVIRSITDDDRMKNHPELFGDSKDMNFFE